MAGPFKLSDSSVLNLFKKKYGKYQENVANGSSVTFSKIKRLQDFVGDEMKMAVDMGWIGGAGGGGSGTNTIPVANRGRYVAPAISPVPLYITAEVDRRTIKQSKDPGAFVEGQKHMVKKVTEKFQWLRNFCLFGDSTGAVATIDSGGVTDNGSGNYTLVLSAATYNRARVEVRELVNITTTDSSLYEITSHTPSTRTIVVQRITGSGVPVAADVVYLQGLANAAPTGLREVLSATSSTLFGVTVEPNRWQAFQKDADGAGLSVDLLNETMLGVHEQSGKSPDLIVLGYTQMRKLLSLIEDQKRYFRDGAKTKSRYGDFSFEGVEFMSVDGVVPIVLDRFMRNDEVWFLNTDDIEIHDAPDSPGWVDDDTGSIWLRKAGTDVFETRYACYGNLYALPNRQGYLYDLAT